MPRKSINDAMNRLAGAESAFLAAEFLAPVVRGGGVGVKIAGVRCTLTVDPAGFQGWGVFRPMSHSAATLVRAATARERRRYLALFAAVRLVVCACGKAHATAVPANVEDERFKLSGPVDVQLTDGVELFDTLLVRFDGVQFWFDEVEARSDPALAAYLREQFSDMTDPAKLQRRGLTDGQRLAYAIAHGRRAAAIEEENRNRDDARLKRALVHAGAALRDFTDVGDSLRVTYTVDGQRHTSVVSKNDLTVQSAGICLSGEDRKFDLGSLVGVLRESR